MTKTPVLIIGEICVDFSLGYNDTPSKMRLGGVTHAARGLWACGIPYAVAVLCPEYLENDARDYLEKHGCLDFIKLGSITGAPNVFSIQDVREISHQGYENILRDSKKVTLSCEKEKIKKYENIVIFPGSFSIDSIAENICPGAHVTIDIAYDVKDFTDLKSLSGKLSTIAISTSSELFEKSAKEEIIPLITACQDIQANYLLLKENRGGSRIFNLRTENAQEIPASLGKTVNSVGVGDVYTSVLSGFSALGVEDAAWRGMQAATKYSQTTFPDDLKRDIQRELKLTINEVRELGGTVLPWHERKEFDIYLAAPDFSYENNPEIDAVVSALEYHNFNIRRPIQENGQATVGSSKEILVEFYRKDLALLHECSLVFAIPLSRDPGTLVEVGIALEMKKPVIVYDPRKENNNTMVICGSHTYSCELEQCLNGVFECLSTLRSRTQ